MDDATIVPGEEITVSNAVELKEDIIEEKMLKISNNEITNPKKKTVTFGMPKSHDISNFEQDKNVMVKKMVRSKSITEFSNKKEEKEPIPNAKRNGKKYLYMSQSPAPKISLIPSVPVYFEDTKKDLLGIRCVCNDNQKHGLLVQCEKCNFWLHGICVNVPRVTKSRTFVCPYCSNHPIRCKCGNNSFYHKPIVKCNKCQFWVHKHCENLRFGKTPPNFFCSRCGGGEFVVSPPNLSKSGINDMSKFLEGNLFDVIDGVPYGMFRNFLSGDLNRSEVTIHQIITRYFPSFISPIFEPNSDFWNLFVSKFSLLFQCNRKIILDLLDYAANSFIYNQNIPSYSRDHSDFCVSETVMPILDTMAISEIANPDSIELILGNDGYVYTSKPFNESTFIADLPGFLCHHDEVFSNDGIPQSVLSISDTELIVDLEDSNFNLAHLISRSFHYNCVAKLYKKNGVIRAGLFGAKHSGPLKEERTQKSKNDTKIIMPFDGCFPYKTPECEWKEKKSKSNAKRFFSKGFPKEEQSLSLLSSFYEDSVTSLPLLIVSDRGASLRSRVQSIVRNKPKMQKYSEENEN